MIVRLEFDVMLVFHPYSCALSTKVGDIFNYVSIPELSSDLMTSDFLKVYPMKLVSLDVNI